VVEERSTTISLRGSPTSGPSSTTSRLRPRFTATHTEPPPTAIPVGTAPAPTPNGEPTAFPVPRIDLRHGAPCGASSRHLTRCDEFDTSSVVPVNDTAFLASYRVANDTGKR
jgi:hypothetical protein